MNKSQEDRAIKALAWMIEHFKHEQQVLAETLYMTATPAYSPELQDAIDLLGELKS